MVDHAPPIINTPVIRGPQKVDCTSDLKVAQINLLHCKKATHAYCKDLKAEQTDLTFIHEPWTRNNKINGFGQLHQRVFYCKTGCRPRAALYVSPRLNAIMLTQYSDSDLVSVRICRNSDAGGDFVVTSAYLPYDSPVPGPSMEKIVEFCDREKLPLLSGIDSNSHHTVWGSSERGSSSTIPSVN